MKHNIYSISELPTPAHLASHTYRSRVSSSTRFVESKTQKIKSRTNDDVRFKIYVCPWDKWNINCNKLLLNSFSQWNEWMRKKWINFFLFLGGWMYVRWKINWKQQLIQIHNYIWDCCCWCNQSFVYIFSNAPTLEKTNINKNEIGYMCKKNITTRTHACTRTHLRNAGVLYLYIYYFINICKYLVICLI